MQLRRAQQFYLQKNRLTEIKLLAFIGQMMQREASLHLINFDTETSANLNQLNQRV